MLLKSNGSLLDKKKQYRVVTIKLQTAEALREATRTYGYINAYLCLPHEPEFKDINMSSALNGLVACVICNIILFVRLEEVASAHRVAAL